MNIGVFVCKCGSNIAATVDTESVAAAAREFHEVVYATVSGHTCAEDGQAAIIKAIETYKLDGVVVASCSPRMHEPTFRRVLERAGLNQFMLEMANIREHVSWIGKDVNKNTEKSIDLVHIAVAKLRRNKPLLSKSFKINKRVLVIGAGITGIQTALDCANGGLDVILVEREVTIGGKMGKLDKTFPTIDCSSCVLGPNMVDVLMHPKITLYAYSEIEEVSGYVGAFDVIIKKKKTYVDWEKCNGCGTCIEKCPSKKSKDSFNEGLGFTKAINIPTPQSIPKKARIDATACIQLTRGKCGNCSKICPTGAINYAQEDTFITEQVGAIVAATGFELIDHTIYGQYGAGKYPDVITSMQYERILSSTGPTKGQILRPSDGKQPKNIVFIQCVGSRDKSIGRPYCSGFCCMYTAKHAIMTREAILESNAYVFYMDIRAPGKGYDEFTRRAQEESGVNYIRGRVSLIYPNENKLIVRGADTLMGCQVEVEADLVVLAVGVSGINDASRMAEKLHISADAYGFFIESHPKLRPIETNTAGIFIAGACQGPKDIMSAVSQGSGAASKVLVLFSNDTLKSNPQVAIVRANRCVGCAKCVNVCPFGAIKEISDRFNNPKAEVIETICQGCGICNSTCPQGAIQLQHFTDNQILAEVDALCQL